MNLKIIYLNEEDNVITDPVINKIKNDITSKGNNWTSIIYDFGQKKFGIPVNAPMKYNQILSDEVTKVFKNTKVNVYVYQSKKANIIGIPGANKNMTPEMLRNEAAREREIEQMNAALMSTALQTGTYASTITPQSGSMYEAISNAIKNANKDGGETKLIYDPLTNKLDTNLEEVTVYISSNYINCMDHDDEIVAAILCEISKNTILFRKYMQDKALNIAVALLSLVGTIYGIYNYYNTANDLIKAQPIRFNLTSRIEFTAQSIIKIIVPFLLAIIAPILIYLIISIYLGKRRNIEYDEFVVKCGYGDALNRAIDNYNKFIFGNSTTQSDAMKALGWYDKIAHFIYKIGMYVYNFFSKLGITSRQSIQRRHDTIQDKTNNYNYNLMDRSDRI